MDKLGRIVFQAHGAFRRKVVQFASSRFSESGIRLGSPISRATRLNSGFVRACSSSASGKSGANWVAGLAAAGGIAALGLTLSSNDTARLASKENVGDLIAKNIEEACHSFVKDFGLDNIDPAKIQSAFQNIRKSSTSGKEEVTLEEFSKAAKVLGIENADVAKSLFQSLDSDKSGTVDLREFSVALASSSGPAGAPGSAARLRALFDLCDLDNSGAVSKEELKHTLQSLLASVDKVSHGAVLAAARTGTGLSADEARAAFVQQAVGEIFGGADAKGVKWSKFKEWAEGKSATSRAFLALFDSLKGAMSDKSFFDETRYGAYAFLLARFTKTASAGVRYLAFTSDVGEAFRPVVSVTLVNLTYAIAIAYCVGDVIYVGYHENKRGGHVARTVAERTVFQALASVALPFLIIHTQVHIFHKLLHSRGGNIAKFGPTVAGLALIPALPTVCDEPVEHAIESAFNTYWPLPDSDKHHSGKAH